MIIQKITHAIYLASHAANPAPVQRADGVIVQNPTPEDLVSEEAWNEMYGGAVILPFQSDPPPIRDEEGEVDEEKTEVDREAFLARHQARTDVKGELVYVTDEEGPAMVDASQAYMEKLAQAALA